MTALVTGASSGIGRDIARKLVKKGFRVIITGRNRQALEELRDELGHKSVRIIVADLSFEQECYRLYEECKKYDVDVLINNAGFGVYGMLTETSLEREVEMIKVNITAMHILLKLFLCDFTEKNRGYILNVASVAGFMAGPYMAAYYAGKNYVVRLTQAVREELRREKSRVYVGALCPGPVMTGFNGTAGVSYDLGGISSDYTAECAVRGLEKRKAFIIPSLPIKAIAYGSRLVPQELLVRAAAAVQRRKGGAENE